MKEEVSITEHPDGYFIVLINHVELAYCGTREEANRWAEHFIPSNGEKIPFIGTKRVDQSANPSPNSRQKNRR